MPRNPRDEFLFAGEFPFHGAARFQHRKHAQLFAKHLLLAAKAPTHPLRVNMHLRERDAEEVGQFGFGLEGRLRA